MLCEAIPKPCEGAFGSPFVVLVLGDEAGERRLGLDGVKLRGSRVLLGREGRDSLEVTVLGRKP